MSKYRGLTWDHPRGKNALIAAANRSRTSGGVDIEWSAQPLEGFESAPIDELAERYDLIVLDHPHLGDALASRALLALDSVFDEATLAEMGMNAVGPSFDSYRYAGKLWALPLDAATQVSALRTDLAEIRPETWDEVLMLSRTVPVALSLAGPHAFLSLCSIAVSLGADPGHGEAAFVEPEVGREALGMLTDLARRAPEGSALLNPIGLLERMSLADDIAYIPLIYGYVNYAARGLARPLSFGEAPSATAGGLRGSTMGGTGIAISSRVQITPELLTHLQWLLSADAQERFIPDNDGQPSRISAWDDHEVNSQSTNFYRATRQTMEQAWVRPRFAGYTDIQAEASALIQQSITESRALDSTLDALDATFAKARCAAQEYHQHLETGQKENQP